MGAKAGRVPPENWSRVTDRATRLMFVIPGGLFAVSMLTEFCRQMHRLPPLGDAALIGLVVVQAATLLTLLVHAESPRTVAVSLVATGTCLALFVLGQPPADRWSMLWWPQFAVTLVSAYALGWTTGKNRWRIAVPGSAVLIGSRIFSGLGSGLSAAQVFTEVIAMCQMAMMVAVGIAGLRSVSRRVQQASDAEREAASQEAIRAAEQTQAHEVERYLHDEIIHCLRAIGMSRYVVDAKVARAYAAAGADSLAAQTTWVADSDLMALLRRLAVRSPLEVRLSGEAPQLPMEALEAITGAAHEALNNVARHSGSQQARIEVQQDGTGVTVSIIDQGCGFAPQRVRGSGLRHSIIERMQEAGGQADISSGIEGTTVRLSWHPASKPPLQRVWVWLPMQRYIVLAVAPYALTDLISSALINPQLGSPILGWVTTALGTLASIYLLSYAWRRVLSPASSVLMPLIGAAALICNVYALSPQNNAYHLWMAGGVIPLLAPVIVVRPILESVPGILVVEAALIGSAYARFGREWSDVHYLGAFLAPLVLGGVVAYHAIVTVFGNQVEQAARHAEASEIRSQYLRIRTAMLQQRLSRVRARVGDFIARVADGTLDCADPGVQQRAAVLQAMVRDEIRFGGGSAELCASLARLRDLGWQVEVLLEPEDAVAADRQIQHLLAELEVPTVGERVAEVPGTEDETSGEHPVTGQARVIVTALPELAAVATNVPQGVRELLARKPRRTGSAELEFGEEHLRVSLPKELSPNPRTQQLPAVAG